MASPPGSPAAASVPRPLSAMIRPNRSSSRMSMSSRAGGGSRASDEDSRTAVKVAVRVRPPLKNGDPGFDLVPQRFRGSTCHVSTSSSLVVDAAGGRKTFVFDRVFGEDVDQEGIFEYVADSVTSFVQGYNVSILAYGQSGAGKSYTMGTTGPRDQGDEKVMGIIPRAAALLFEKLDGSSPARPSGPGIKPPSRISGIGMPLAKTSLNKNWQLKATYVEIYNEQLRDLLLPESTAAHERPAVAIREDPKGRILLTGLTQMPINSIEDLLNALNFGSSIRQTDATAVNAKSSRSHAVFSLNLVQKKSSTAPLTKRDKRMSVPIEAMSGGSENWVTVDSKLHFVDLAGSERLKNTQAQGERAKEGISINAGLASLGKVISQLSSRSHGSYVSYRDSKLTRLLQDSLGGNAITYMIACVNPAEFHLSETLNTVQYAQRARAIQIKPQIQQVHDDSDKQAIIDRLRAEVQFLRDQIRISERTERKKGAPQERAERQQERELELHNQLLDIQENYNALSARHAKLISEITKARDSDSAETPMLKDAIGDSALERLKRSNSFAEAVESVVLEYEKTIQSLESSLTNTRSSLSANESELLEKETRIAFLESQAQQLQSRLQKAMDREASNEDYVKSLEAQIDSSASGIERNDTMIIELREKLQKARENEASAEEYISTLEERLAENEQEVDLMQREIERLKHVVERQRSIGKLDNLLYELDNIRQADAKGDEPVVNGHAKKLSDSIVDAQSASNGPRQFNTNIDAIAEENDAERPTTAGASDPSAAFVAGGHEGRGDAHNTLVVSRDLPADEALETPASPAQSKFVQDKLESVTQELFDLKVEHEGTLEDYDRLQSKYQEALRTLAALQDAVDEARHRRSSISVSSRPTSFLANAGVNGLRGEDGQPSSSRTLSAELSLAVQSGNTSNLGDEIEENTEVPDDEVSPEDIPLPQSPTESTFDLSHTESILARELETLKLLNAEKEQRVAELSHRYTDLQEKHQDTLDYVEELKSEVTKAQMARPASPTARVIRRKSSQNVMSANDRSNRAFASLRNLALENFEQQPDTIQNFEINLNAIMTELHMRSERVQALEGELASVRKEMEGKMTLISGLAKERSSLKASSPLDISIVASMQDQIRQSEADMKELKEAHEKREQELLAEIASLKASLDSATLANAVTSPASGEAAESLGDEASERENLQQAQIRKLQEEARLWQSKHVQAIESTKAAEKQHLQTVSELESAIKTLEADHAWRINELERAKGVEIEALLEKERLQHAELVQTLQAQVDEHRSTAIENAARLAELEESHARIIRQVEADAEARELTEKELATHRSLVANLENQVEEHKAALDIHQQRLESLQQSHVMEMEKLTAELAAKESSTHALEEDLSKARADIDGLLKGIGSALSQETDMSKVESQIRALAEERTSLMAKMDEAIGELQTARTQLSESTATVATLKGTVKELEIINAETIKELEKISQKERKSSRLVQELEDQLNQNYDQHEAAANRLSALQTERSQELQEALQRKENLEKEVEESRIKIALLESQLVDAKRHSNRESVDPRESLQRSNSNNSNLRKSTSHTSLPSPPPAIPLPPLPGSPPPQASAPSPPTSRHQSKDIAQAQLVEDQEARIRTIEKHLFAEKQLTATLEDALTDLEASSQKTKQDIENWRKKCASLEEELEVMRKERSMARHSLQAFEEERNMRLRVEAERAQLEARMSALSKTKKKKGGLNCF
ncbi:kinesin-domain-containing protein [Westerdykella ornata]|uniref:Kinesin-domain-containing protein n=1 Tax=Westerdykella ornata TaxID=318751 RepID=A0A6A6JD38_WESOR|nr:kinesin-domain-containing protein [Westerdykella ornata]KAF2274540.1 kinesin-domain-containing protein [Westerdykella ornata]